jgi:AsmA protein
MFICGIRWKQKDSKGASSVSQSSNKSRMRWVKIFGGGLAILIVLIVAAPFLVDFSQFKPQIQGVVADAVDAKIDFESARLQLFPSIGIKLTKVSVENTAPDFVGTKMFAVDSVVVNTGLMALLQGKVEGQVEIKKPEFILAKKGIKTNVTSLVKPAKTSPAASQPTAAPEEQNKPQSTPAATKEEKSAQVAMLKERVLLKAVVIEDANITIRDLGNTETSGKEPVRIRDLDIAITNIGLDRDIEVKISTKMQVAEGDAQVTGPIAVNAKVHANLNADGLEKATFSGKLSFDDLMIKFKNAFAKSPGIPLNLSFDGVFKPDDFELQKLQFKFHTLDVDATAHVNHFADPALEAKVGVKNDNLSALGDVLPEHRSMLLSGQLALNLDVTGVLSKLDGLLVKFGFGTKLAGTDLAMDLDAHGVYPFRGHFNMKSKRIDVDGLLRPFVGDKSGPKSADPKVGTNGFETQPAGSPAPGGQPAAGPAASAPPAKDFALTPEQKKLIQGTDAEVRVDLQEIVYSGLKLTNFKLDLDQKNLMASLKQFNIDGFGGRIAAHGRVNLEEAPLAFEGDFKMQDIHPEQVMLVVKPEHKDLLIGRMNLDLAVRGKGTTVPTLNKTLNGGGTFKFNEGQLNTPSIAAKMQEQFDHYVESLSGSNVADGVIGAAKKLLENPLVKASGKAPPDLDKVKDNFKSVAKVKIGQKASTSKDLKDVSGKLEIKDGKIYILSQRADSGGMMDVKSFVDLEMNLGGGAVYTASEQTKNQLLSQSQYASVLFDDKNNLVLNLSLSGTVMDPKVGLSTEAMRENFKRKSQALLEKEAKQAAENYIKGLLGGEQAKEAAKAKIAAEAKKHEDEAKAKAQEEIEKNKDKAKDALKGLFGR